MSSSGKLVLSLLALVGACGDAPTGRTAQGVTAGGKGDDLDEDTTGDDGSEVPASDHRGEVQQCEAVADHAREHVNPARVDAVVDLERDRNDCLVRADDAAAEVIEAQLVAHGDAYVGQAARTLRIHREDAVGVCNALVEAHADAASDALSGVATACIAGVELHLARLLDAYVDFGVAPFSIPAARDRYPSCYATLDAALSEAPGVDPDAEEAAAQTELAACIGRAHADLVPELAARAAASFPGRELTDVEAAIGEAMRALDETRAIACAIGVHAGPSRATPAADLDVAECRVDVAIQAGEMITWVAPDLLGEPDTDHGSGSSSEGAGSESEGSGSDDGSSDDAGSESSTSL